MDTQADVEDVRVEYDTFVDDEDIEIQINRAAREIRRYNDVSGWDDDHVRDLEASYTAFRIATRIDRSEMQSGAGGNYAMFDSSVVDELADTINRLDKSGELIDVPETATGGTWECF